jgi:hypothetical protein
MHAQWTGGVLQSIGIHIMREELVITGLIHATCNGFIQPIILTWKIVFLIIGMFSILNTGTCAGCDLRIRSLWRFTSTIICWLLNYGLVRQHIYWSNGISTRVKKGAVLPQVSVQGHIIGRCSLARISFVRHYKASSMPVQSYYKLVPTWNILQVKIHCQVQ